MDVNHGKTFIIYDRFGVGELVLENLERRFRGVRLLRGTPGNPFPEHDRGDVHIDDEAGHG